MSENEKVSTTTSIMVDALEKAGIFNALVADFGRAIDSGKKSGDSKVQMAAIRLQLGLIAGDADKDTEGVDYGLGYAQAVDDLVAVFQAFER